MKKLLSVLLTLALCFSLAACTKEESKEQEELVNPIKVTIEMKNCLGEDVKLDNFTPVEKTEFSVEEGTNVLDATRLFCLSNDIAIEVDTAGNYIVSMAGAGEKDVQATTGWTFKLDGESPVVGADQVVLEEGSEICWEFIDFTNF